MPKIFGFEFGSSKPEGLATPVRPQDATSANVSSTYGVMEAGFKYSEQEKTNIQSKIKTREELYKNSEVNFAVDEVINEMVDFSGFNPLEVDFGDSVSAKQRDVIAEEVKNILPLFQDSLNLVLTNWYVRGVKTFFIQVAQDGKSIHKLVEINPWEVELKKPSSLKQNEQGIMTYTEEEPYWLLSQKNGSAQSKIKLPYDSVVRFDVGLGEGSYLDYAIKPMNDLLTLENASVIYRITRAPEKRAFYVDTGQLQPTKAEEFMKQLMSRFKSSIEYDSKTGAISTSNKNAIPATVDYWMPRREGSTGTEIDVINETSSAMSNVMDEVNYFRQKLYSALFIPKSRITDEPMYSIGQSGTISRDEVKFSQYISKLEAQWMRGIKHILRVNLGLKGLVTKDEFELIEKDINLSFLSNDFFAESKRIDIITSRVSLLEQIDPYIGTYFSKDWVQKEVLKMSDVEIELEDEQMSKEKSEGIVPDQESADNAQQ